MEMSRSIWLLAITAGLALVACQAAVPTADVNEVPTTQPTPTLNVPIADYTDEIGDTIDCETEAAVDAPAADIQHIIVWVAPDGGYVDITLGVPADETLETAFSFTVGLVAGYPVHLARPVMTVFEIGVHNGRLFQDVHIDGESVTVIEDAQERVQVDPATGILHFVLSPYTTAFKVGTRFQSTADGQMICDPANTERAYIIRP